ncbi:MAG: hypothetical protein JWM85_1283 [Acidimicrobiaceae bacterium]|nr:hypothetical protein [Acidimicrobiaceae bacterium]
MPELEVTGVAKSFGAVAALRNASLTVYSGEVVGLLGDNGAGKSTFVRCITGRLHPDSGTIKVAGEEKRIRSPEVARALGIEVVHQDLALVNSLDVAANLFMGREIVHGAGFFSRLGLLKKRDMRKQAQAVLEQVGVKLPSVSATVGDLSGGQRQGIAVGRAVAWGQRVVLMDEPAAALGVEQAQHVLDLIRRLRDQGIAVVMISHNMEHVLKVCDRVVVMRRGESIGSARVPEVTGEMLVGFITGAIPIPDAAQVPSSSERMT